MRGPSLTSAGTTSSSSSLSSNNISGSAAASGGAGTVSGGTNKKKFGKNLNKLVNRPAAPPIVDRGAHGSSRNGLLLLSKAKTGGVGCASSGGNSANISITAGATGSSGTATALSGTSNVSSGAGLTSSSTSSGGLLAKSLASASLAPSSTSGKPSTHHDLLLSTAKGGVASAASAVVVPDAWGGAATTGTNSAPPAPVPIVPFAHDERSARNLEPTAALAPATRDAPVPDGPAWDEYGGRGGTTSTSSGRRLVDVDPQADAMSRLAKEKAEQKRREEAARIHEQQAKAAMRLRELELRRGGTVPPHSADVNVTTPPPLPSLSQPRWEATRSGTKELWEPDQQTSRRGMDRRGRSDSAGDRSVDGPSPSHVNPNAAATTGPPLIHLNAFDDRDRGEPARAAGSAPRMLFDPKSGSMVAVKSRDDHHNHNPPSHATGAASSSAAANTKKKATRATKTRGKDAPRGDSPNDVTKIVRTNNGTLSVLATKSKKDAATAPSPKEAAAVNAARRLPRTCGVLYQRDDKGNCFCADDCDGDLGYGSHSVPGGRTRNPDAYAAFVSEHYRRRGAGVSNLPAGEYESQLHYDMYGGADENYDGDVAQLYTGFNPEREFVPPEPIEYVRADDKLELVTGVDDSPSLKPTAKEFAPSQAALAAARAAAESKKDASLLESSDDDEDEVYGNDDDDDDANEDDGPIGLGFDPTLDMDFVMQSPSHDDDRKRVESLVISALDLEPTAFASTEEALGPRHIFAFGTSGTWGASHPTASSLGGDWKVSDVNDVNALFGSGAFGVNTDDGEAKGKSAATAAVSSTSSSVASFLNIPASSSWGSPSVATLSGLANVAASATAPGSGD